MVEPQIQMEKKKGTRTSVSSAQQQVRRLAVLPARRGIWRDIRRGSLTGGGGTGDEGRDRRPGERKLRRRGERRREARKRGAQVEAATRCFFLFLSLSSLWF
jgi:hypothetical protein